MHFKQLASRWEESETCLLPYRALNTICSFWSCCEGWLGHKAEGIWNFRVPGIKAFSLTPRLHDKKSCVKKPRASHPDFLTLFIKKLKGLACQTNYSDSAVYDIRSCMQASTCTSNSFSASAFSRTTRDLLLKTFATVSALKLFEGQHTFVHLSALRLFEGQHTFVHLPPDFDRPSQLKSPMGGKKS